MLQPLGISPQAEALYVVLAPLGTAPLVELASVARQSVETIIEPLHELRQIGLATEVAANQWRALPLLNAAKGLQAKRQAELDAAALAAESLHTQMLAASESHDDAVQTVIGRDAIVNARIDMCAQAEKEICAFDKPPYVQAQEAATESLHQDSPEWQALERGVAIRGIYHPGFDASRLELLKLFIGKGEQSRVGQVPMKLVLVDKRIALIPSMSSYEPGQELRASIIRHPMLVEALQWLFEAVWDASVAAMVANLGRETNPRHDLLVSLLMTGSTDQSIAYQLGVTERSVRRWISDLMDEFGVRTRLQLGAALSRASDRTKTD